MRHRTDDRRSLTPWIILAAAGLFAVMLLNRPKSVDTEGPGGGATLTACAPAPFRSGGERFQGPMLDNARPFELNGYSLRPLAAFDVQAQVMAREIYRFDASAVLSPVDFALGWERMADPAVYGQLGITQSGRWYHYRWDAAGPPIPLEEIVRSSANMHMIPADAHIEERLLDIDAGDNVRLRGWLVEANGPNGFNWRSSTTRSDSGNGACEVILVCALETNPR